MKKANNNMVAIMIEPGKFPKVIETTSKKRDLKALVGGVIEEKYMFNDVAILVDKHADNKCVEFNRAIYVDGEMVDYVDSNMVIVGINEDGFTDLTEEQIKKYTKMFHNPEKISRMDTKMIVRSYEEEFDC